MGISKTQFINHIKNNQYNQNWKNAKETKSNHNCWYCISDKYCLILYLHYDHIILSSLELGFRACGVPNTRVGTKFRREYYFGQYNTIDELRVDVIKGIKQLNQLIP